MGPSSHPIFHIDHEVHATDAHILPDVSIEASLLVFRSGLVPVTQSSIDATPRSRSFNRGSSRACSMRAILVDPEGESLDRLMSCSRCGLHWLRTSSCQKTTSAWWIFAMSVAYGLSRWWVVGWWVRLVVTTAVLHTAMSAR